jgi:hypothetical protein
MTIQRPIAINPAGGLTMQPYIVIEIYLPGIKSLPYTAQDLLKIFVPQTLIFSSLRDIVNSVS